MLQGNLKDYSLPILLAVLANKRETGRLDVYLESGTGCLYLRSGELMDARVGSVRGLSAVNVLLSSDNARFVFQPLSIPPESGFNDENERLLLKRLLSLNLGTDQSDSTAALPKTMSPPANLPPVARESGISPDPRFVAAPEKATRKLPIAPVEAAAPGYSDEIGLSIANQSFTYTHRRQLVVAAILLLIGVPTIIGLTLRFSKGESIPLRTESSGVGPRAPAVGAADSNSIPHIEITSSAAGTKRSISEGSSPLERLKEPKPVTPTAADKEPPPQTFADTNADAKKPGGAAAHKSEPKVLSVAVVTRIENGRVVEAYVSNPHPGLEAYEATAVHLARQKRYAKDKSGTETIFLVVTK